MSEALNEQSLWNYPAGSDDERPHVVTGYTVDASDGKVGTVLRTDTTPGNAHLTITTGPWFLGRQLVIPAGLITSVDHGTKSVVLACTLAQAKDAPSYDTQENRDAFDSYRRDAVSYFLGSEPYDRATP